MKKCKIGKANNFLNMSYPKRILIEAKFTVDRFQKTDFCKATKLKIGKAEFVKLD